MNNPFLARFDQTPALVSPDMQRVFEAALYQLNSQMASPEFKAEMASSDENWWGDPGSFRSFLRPYNVKDGVLQIPVKGVLLHDFPYQFGSWATGYEYIWKAFERGLGDGNVRGIALIEDSPGGEVAGNFDLVDKMFARKGEKPVRAYAMESAYSAAYSIASVADTITVSRTGGVGSIGVVTMHVDYSKALEAEGIKVTFIHFGKHKVDGNPYQELPKEVKDRIQARIDELGEVFVATVARNRGMDEKAVRDTEALTFSAKKAVSNRLADDIGSLDDAVAAFAADLSQDEGDEEMSNQDKSAVDQAAIDNARAEGVAQGKTEGAKAERERITAVVNSDEGKKRPTMALKMATGEKFASLESETILGMLADMPEEKAETPKAKEEDPNEPKGKDGASKDFAAAMERSDHPNLGEQAKTEKEGERAQEDKVIDDAFAMAGFKPKKNAA